MDKIVLQATKQAEASLIVQEKEAQAGLIVRKAEAEGISALAKSYSELSTALGGPAGLLQYLMIEKGTYVSLAHENALAIKGLNPKVSRQEVYNHITQSKEPWLTLIRSMSGIPDRLEARAAPILLRLFEISSKPFLLYSQLSMIKPEFDLQLGWPLCQKPAEPYRSSKQGSFRLFKTNSGRASR